MATSVIDPALRSCQPLFILLSGAATAVGQLPLNLINSFQLRSLLPRWRFDGTQQDAVEFFQSFLTAASEYPLSRRCATVDLTTGLLAVEDGPMIMLLQHWNSRTLQSLIDECSPPSNTTLLGQQQHAILTQEQGRTTLRLQRLVRNLKCLCCKRDPCGERELMCNPVFVTSALPHTVVTIVPSAGRPRRRTGSPLTIYLLSDFL